MSTYEQPAVDLRIAQQRVAELERQLTAERQQGLDAEHRLRHAQEGLRRLQTQIERHGEAETRRLEGAGASKEELALAGADQAVTLALVASTITSSIVCGCAEHAVGRVTFLSAEQIERRYIDRPASKVPHLWVVPRCGRTTADEHLAATDDGWPDGHGDGPEAPPRGAA